MNKDLFKRLKESNELAEPSSGTSGELKTKRLEESSELLEKAYSELVFLYQNFITNDTTALEGVKKVRKELTAMINARKQ